ncbi:MAG: hypothetical protein Q3966_01420 [Neisseria sp.]|nr:hypothetical protein [Neisseria sp.]
MSDKNIHAVQCPQCSSTEQTEIKENHYRCASCGTEYFVENKGTQIRHYHYYGNQAAGNSQRKPPSKKSVFLTAGATALLLAAWMAVSLSGAGRPKHKPDPSDAIVHRIDYDQAFYFQHPEYGPVLAVVAGYYQKSPSYRLAFYSQEQNKILADTAFPQPYKDIKNTQTLHFDNGDTYILTGKGSFEYQNIYRVNKAALTLEKMNETFEKANPELAKGIALIKGRDEGDAFKIMTNDGKELLYYPQSNKTFTEEQARDFIFRGKWQDTPQTQEKTILTFAGEEAFKKEAQDPDYLFEYKIRETPGYPFRPVNFYSKEAAGKYIAWDDEVRRTFRVAKWRDVTPGRDYYRAKVRCHNDAYAVISFNQTIVATSPQFLQLLDLKTGEPVWTQPLEGEYPRIGCMVGNDGKTHLYEDKNDLFTWINAKDGSIIGKKSKWPFRGGDAKPAATQENGEDVNIVSLYEK